MKKDYKQSKESGNKKLHQQLVIAITLSITFGLGWGIGLPATQFPPPASTILSGLFICFNAFHGLSIFILYCLRNESIRNKWKKWFGVLSKSKPTDLQTSTAESRRYDTSNPRSTTLQTSIGMQTLQRAKVNEISMNESVVGEKVRQESFHKPDVNYEYTKEGVTTFELPEDVLTEGIFDRLSMMSAGNISSYSEDITIFPNPFFKSNENINLSASPSRSRVDVLIQDSDILQDTIFSNPLYDEHEL